MTKNKFYLYFVFLFCAVFALIIYLLILLNKKNKIKTCEANVYFTISSLNDSYTFDGHVLFDMSNNSGYVSLSGKIVDGDESYYLSQDIAFDYMADGEGRYKILPGDKIDNRYGSIPDDLIIPIYDIMGLSGKSPIFIFTRNRDYIVWGTLNSPVMTCVFTMDR
ncbi:hypothetical protein AI2943V1_3963 [Klebsiella oxytoca]|uniref:hypothetical protein n=1 Tax=Klebsiella grimontii TaxID=2058152 RepID=UPI0012B9C067|nr:hypothetical protein [Klebsiella grimontii]CAF2895482.1 hypothetical protein AI2943V1_3963 [Klebsiella oxytoca]MDM6726302.1 hypothetical protein [Klebsiella grimontii]MDM7224799.1 hypothetical protein [Klebsiella grimontii]MDM7254836.1 hypothetical protein [Klebsiella grimontii]MDM7272566.1 hypothetical protein [Klebsiella grimontii]